MLDTAEIKMNLAHIYPSKHTHEPLCMHASCLKETALNCAMKALLIPTGINVAFCKKYHVNTKQLHNLQRLDLPLRRHLKVILICSGGAENCETPSDRKL